MSWVWTTLWFSSKQVVMSPFLLVPRCHSLFLIFLGGISLFYTPLSSPPSPPPHTHEKKAANACLSWFISYIYELIYLAVSFYYYSWFQSIAVVVIIINIWVFAITICSAHLEWNLDGLLEKIWEYLNLTRIYTKPKGMNPDYEDPVILSSKHTTVEDFCERIHKDMVKQFK